MSKIRETIGGLLYVAYIKTMARHLERHQDRLDQQQPVARRLDATPHE